MAGACWEGHQSCCASGSGDIPPLGRNQEEAVVRIWAHGLHYISAATTSLTVKPPNEDPFCLCGDFGD